MPKKDASAAFDRDFGYLMPFLDKVRAAGEALPLGAREEIASLLAGERERWTRVRELLTAGDSPAPSPPTTPRTTARSPSPAPAPPVSRSASPAPAGTAIGRLGFTVGTLRRRD